MSNLNVNAKASIKLTKLDEHGNVVEVKQQEIDLTREEAEAIWLSQKQE